MRSLYTILILVLLSIGLSVVNVADAADFEIVVKQGLKTFTPQLIKIKPGDRVLWANKDDVEHFLTSAGPATKQIVMGTENLEIHKLLHPGEGYTHSFTQTETYYYFCAIHTQMWGTVIVEK